MLITGASAGIGRATAVALVGTGAKLLVTGRSPDDLAITAQRTGATLIVADLRDMAATESLIEQATRLGPVDVLINNAGIGWAGPLADMPDEPVADLIDVNLRAPIRLTRALLPGMLERRHGRIVNVASLAGHVGVRSEAVYAATKAGLLGFSESLRYELEGSGVGVTTVSPGVVATGYFERRGAAYQRTRPRPLPPERIAQAIIQAIRHDRWEIVEPGWLRFPIWLRGAWPALYRALARRWG